MPSQAYCNMVRQILGPKFQRCEGIAEIIDSMLRATGGTRIRTKSVRPSSSTKYDEPGVSTKPGSPRTRSIGESRFQSLNGVIHGW